MDPIEKTPHSLEELGVQSASRIIETQDLIPETRPEDDDLLQTSEPLLIKSEIYPEPEASLNNLEKTVEVIFPELPEGTAFYPVPHKMSNPIINSSERNPNRSNISLRIDALSRPKMHCINDNLNQFSGVLEDRCISNLKKQLQEQEVWNAASKREHAKKCQTASIPRRHKRQPTTTKSEQVLPKFKNWCKREAFDRLADKIFQRLPVLALDADIINLSQLDPSRQRMINVLFTSLTSYAGMPLTAHDHELYVHLSVALASFFNNVIEAVRSGKDAAIEQSSQKKKVEQQYKNTMSSEILKDVDERILKNIFYQDDI